LGEKGFYLLVNINPEKGFNQGLVIEENISKKLLF